MKKSDVLTAIIDVYDNNSNLNQMIELLRNENEQLRDRIGIEAEEIEPLPSVISSIDAFMIQIGRKKVYEDSVYSWRDVTVNKDEDGAIRSQKFEKWVDGYINDVPDFMSKNEFRAYFFDELRADYDRKKEEAIKALEESEEGEE